MTVDQHSRDAARRGTDSTLARLQGVRKYFEVFTRAFAETHFGNCDVTQKLGHSMRVARLCREIACDLGWPDNEAGAAEAMGWLHDIGRFVQYDRYGTFNDAASVDHGALGADLILWDGVLTNWDTETARAVVFAVRHHNQRCLPECTDRRPMQLLKLLRDADKIDIMSTFGQAIRNGDTTRYPQVFANRNARTPASNALLAQLDNGEIGSYDHISSVSDIILVGVSWVRDINFSPALERVRQRGLLDGFEGMLSESPGALDTLRRVREELDRRLTARLWQNTDRAP